MKKALIFNPYLDSLGGGERYTLGFASALSDLGYTCELAWTNSNILAEAENRFGINLSNISVNPNAYKNCTTANIYQKFLFQKNYDLIFWVSDGSLPFLFAKKNLVHFQVPFTRLSRFNFLNFIKSKFISSFIYNSEFTKNINQKGLDKDKSVVLYPPVDIDNLSEGKKEKMIISVARFSSVVTSKRQDSLIESFRIFSKKHPGYKLYLLGGHTGSQKILSDLKSLAAGLDVEITANPSFEFLKNIYSKSRYFWHAAGYQVDEIQNPEKAEHFGMTTVESMAAGCVPIVINKGGQKEVIENGVDGFLCNTPEEISEKTIFLDDNPTQYQKLSANAKQKAKKFSVATFKQDLAKLLNI